MSLTILLLLAFGFLCPQSLLLFSNILPRIWKCARMSDSSEILRVNTELITSEVFVCCNLHYMAFPPKLWWNTFNFKYAQQSGPVLNWNLLSCCLSAVIHVAESCFILFHSFRLVLTSSLPPLLLMHQTLTINFCLVECPWQSKQIFKNLILNKISFLILFPSLLFSYIFLRLAFTTCPLAHFLNCIFCYLLSYLLVYSMYILQWVTKCLHSKGKYAAIYETDKKSKRSKSRNKRRDMDTYWHLSCFYALSFAILPLFYKFWGCISQ